MPLLWHYEKRTVEYIDNMQRLLVESGKEGFKIQYSKRGNIIQPVIQITEKDEDGFEQKK